jgi:hypothetical protein
MAETPRAADPDKATILLRALIVLTRKHTTR